MLIFTHSVVLILVIPILIIPILVIPILVIPILVVPSSSELQSKAVVMVQGIDFDRMTCHKTHLTYKY